MREEDTEEYQARQKGIAIRRAEIEQARQENRRNIFETLWQNIITGLFSGYAKNGETGPDYEAHQFISVLSAIAEFVRICYRKQDAYTPIERQTLIIDLARAFPFEIPDSPNPDFNQKFFIKLEAFIAGTLAYLQKFHTDEELAGFFIHLREWVPEILKHAVPAYAPPYAKKENTETARLFCDAYCSDQKLRLKKLLLIGRGMAVFNDCNALRLTEMGNLNILPEDTVREMRIRALPERFAVLKDALRKIEGLSFELAQLFAEEERECIAILKENAKAELAHPSVDHVLQAVEHHFDRINVNASFLNYYMPNLEQVDNPNEPLFTTIREFYFTNKLSTTGEVPAIAQAINILNEDFETVQGREKNKLLGDQGTLSTERLDFLLLMGCPALEQLQILESLYNEIVKKEQKKYSPPKKRFGQKAELYNKTQFDHIRILQEKYLVLISANRTGEVINAAEESELLDFKLPGKEKTAKDEAWKIFEEEKIISTSSGDEKRHAL
ncbi:MAG: hypothetical protein SFW07_04675 [Gammaproteobacteria bacterium]|nr:hypothetical protein [Gammaproteobacteria bacterium]